MNRLLTPLLLFLALLGLAAAISLRACVPRPPGDKIFACDPGRVRAVRLHSGGETVEVRRKDGGWIVAAEDFRDTADGGAAERLVLAASQPLVSHHIPAGEARDQLSEFGLRSPKRWIEVEERRKWRVLLGKESAIEGLVYARLEDGGDVFLVPRDYAELAGIPSNKLRFPNLSPIRPGDVDRFVVRAGAGEIEIARGPAGWEFRRPLTARADTSAVEALLEDVLGATILAFEGKDAGDLGHLGIEPGRREFAVYALGREKPLVVRFGGEAPGDEGGVFAQLTARDVVVRLAPEVKERALQSGEDLRDRALLPVNLDIVDAVEIRLAGDALVVRRDGEGWVASGGSARVGDWWPAALAEELARARVAEFIREAPGRAPDAGVRFLAILSENTPEAEAGTQEVAAVDFWKEGGGLVAKVTGQSGAVRADPEVLDFLQHHMKEIPGPAPDAPPAEKSLGDSPPADTVQGE